MGHSPRSQVPRDEAIAHAGNFWMCWFCPSKFPNPLLLAHGLRHSPTHTPHLKWRHRLLTSSPAHLLSCLTIPSRKPIWSSDTLGALSPYHAPRPRQPLQALGVNKKLVRASGEGREVGGRGEAVRHSPGSPSVLVPQPCLAFPLVPEKSRGT